MRKVRGDRDRGEEHEVRLYHVHRLDIRRQLIPPIIFFVAIAVIILFSIAKHNKNVGAGKVDMTSNAVVVDYLTAAIGAPVNENTDEIDDSYGDYFYIGADFYEVRKETEMALFDKMGFIVFEGEEQVTSFAWRSVASDITEEEVHSMAEELTTAFGTYEQDVKGNYLWTASKDGILGESDNLTQISLGFDTDGKLTIEAK